MSDLSFTLKNPSLTILTGALMLLFAVIALFLNGLAFYITVFRLKKKTAAVGLMTIIATLDIIISSNVIIADLMNFASSHQSLTVHNFCTTTGMIYMLVPMSSIDGIGLLSLLRLLSVSYNIEFRAAYWYLAMGAMFIYNVVINVIGVIQDIYIIQPSQSHCYASYTPGTYSEIYSQLLALKFVIMFSLILVSYTGITITVYKTFSRLNLMNSNSSGHNLCDKPYTTYQRKLIYKLVILITLYVVCFVPGLAFTIYTVTTNNLRTPVMDSISGITFALALVVNAIFVLIYQKEARDIFLSMLPRWLYTSKSNFEPAGLQNVQI
ncbi:family A G protein-coupled receptor-like protein [Conidiobolus coronatus NRRL 28638]|uniref:Family A G protein-coupled receptor-like protein n=1 Tax=Conidiobolus coronatus (strain ATCC 28846 / CBS 209.66 / NRRL 28638) TaxID=796925 RepID=A0A137NUQ0_CONC2|nr:family A G protein-coupled receptor-like protein [Conidiobolus coronatus NRRL 28638]|eukprot:KXN66334.1 family A G protein-coupled receptor-like protein [Conidiobolus coronatus NRRL 28638]